MKQSLSFYLVLFILRLKGTKKDFSKDPVDYKKIRKEDVYQPKGRFYTQNILRRFGVLKTSVTEVATNKAVDSLLIYVHGGAFISGPAIHHWNAIKEMAINSSNIIWMVDYPKAPEHKIAEISKNIDAVYQAAKEQYPGKKITMVGDSVGGTLIASLTQRLVKDKLDLPDKIILVSPVMDASLTNPKIDNIDSIDPMLSKKGIGSAKRMCGENNDLKNEMISPLYGSFNNFPKTILFLAENDITYPDQLLAVEKIKNAQVDVDLVKGNNMPHIWPILPVMKEAKIALNQMIDIINS